VKDPSATVDEEKHDRYEQSDLGSSRVAGFEDRKKYCAISVLKVSRVYYNCRKENSKTTIMPILHYCPNTFNTINHFANC
jgi:hypothetical protein